MLFNNFSNRKQPICGLHVTSPNDLLERNSHTQEENQKNSKSKNIHSETFLDGD